MNSLNSNEIHHPSIEEALEKIKQDSIQALSIVLRSVLSEDSHSVRSQLTKLNIESHEGIMNSLKVKGASEDMTSDINVAIALATLISAIYKLNQETDLTLESVFDKNMTCSHDSNGHNASTQADTEKVRDQEHHSTIIKEEKKALFSIIQELMTHVQIVSKSIQTMTITSTVTSETIVQSDITGDIIENMRGSIAAGVELELITTAIEKLNLQFPSYPDQSHQLTERQEKIMSASALASIIDRVSNTKRRLGEQRADFKKQDMLVKMVEQIIKSQQRSLENQRTTMSDSRKDAIEMGKIGEKIEKQAARRMGNQDWVTKEERFRQEFVELFKLMSEPKRLDNQRVEMNEDGIKEAGIRSICSKIGRMEERRLGNQEATFSASKSNQPRSSGTPKTVI